jgi:hypothetical protein
VQVYTLPYSALGAHEWLASSCDLFDVCITYRVLQPTRCLPNGNKTLSSLLFHINMHKDLSTASYKLTGYTVRHAQYFPQPSHCLIRYYFARLPYTRSINGKIFVRSSEKKINKYQFFLHPRTNFRLPEKILSLVLR